MIVGRFCMLSALGLVLAACATGPKLSETQVAAVPPEQGRVYFYRTMLLGAAIQPLITLNSENVGNCQPGGVFYKDVRPGDYQATVSTEVEHRLTFTIARGEVKYVRCYLSIGLVVGQAHLELVSPQEAQGEISRLSLTGVKVP